MPQRSGRRSIEQLKSYFILFLLGQLMAATNFVEEKSFNEFFFFFAFTTFGLNVGTKQLKSHFGLTLLARIGSLELKLSFFKSSTVHQKGERREPFMAFIYLHANHRPIKLYHCVYKYLIQSSEPSLLWHLFTCTQIIGLINYISV